MDSTSILTKKNLHAYHAVCHAKTCGQPIEIVQSYLYESLYLSNEHYSLKADRHQVVHTSKYMSIYIHAINTMYIYNKLDTVSRV